MITVVDIMNTGPCEDWPQHRVESALAHLDCASWSTLVESARADGWRVVSLSDLLLTLCRRAVQRHYEPVLVPWVVAVTHQRVAGQRLRWPSAPQSVLSIWDRLERWGGSREEILGIHADAASAYAATSTSASAAADAAVVATDARAATDAYGAADAAAYAYDADAMLLDLARRLDAVESGDRSGASIAGQMGMEVGFQ